LAVKWMAMQHRFHQFALRLSLAVLAVAAGLAPLHAEDASPWSAEAHSRVRLIAGTNAPGQAMLRAGLDIRLAPGWKTYWRYPGDSGVPPSFDFSASHNVNAVKVLWPAPQRMADGAGQSIGYDERVIMPLRVVPKDPSRPAVLELKLSYAVCEKLCVPAQATARLNVMPTESSLDAALAAAEARVPKPAELGGKGALAIRSVRREDGDPRPRVVVEVAAPKDTAIDLFAEGPTPAWALPLPEPSGSPAPGLRQFSFELDGLPAGAKPKGVEFTFTLVAETEAIEVKTRLD
jgi:DsbC/DsbD-like thiol-disulfide interchange protein